MYHAANFFAPSTLSSLAPRFATFSNTPDTLSFSDIFFSPPDFWRDIFAPFGLRKLLIDSPFAVSFSPIGGGTIESFLVASTWAAWRRLSARPSQHTAFKLLRCKETYSNIILL